MNLLAIDPGPTNTAFVRINNDSLIIAANKIETAQFVTNLKHGDWGFNLVVACEHIQSFGMAVGAEVFETCYWIGEIRRICIDRDFRFYRVFRSDEKMALCHSMKASDANIRQAIIDRYGGKEAAIGRKKTPGPLYTITGDMWSALAVAIAFKERVLQQLEVQEKTAPF